MELVVQGESSERLKAPKLTEKEIRFLGRLKALRLTEKQLRFLKALVQEGASNTYQLKEPTGLGYSTVQHVRDNLLRRGHIRQVEVQNSSLGRSERTTYDLTEAGVWALLLCTSQQWEVQPLYERYSLQLPLVLGKWHRFKEHDLEQRLLDTLRRINPHEKEIHYPLGKGTLTIPVPEDPTSAFYLSVYLDQQTSWSPQDRERWDMVVSQDQDIAKVMEQIKSYVKDLSMLPDDRDRLRSLEFKEKILSLKIWRVE
jgi:DNA-binding MarR family transcriptional regulator